MVQLYADLVLDLSNGNVQLCAKEEYLSGQKGWAANFAWDCWIIEAYAWLSAAEKRDFVVMLKTGTHDDSVASHYVLIDPARKLVSGENDLCILDPAMRAPAGALWRLSDSAAQICKDNSIAREWERCEIDPCQISGVFLFGRWRASSDQALMQPILRAWANQHRL